MEGRTGQPLIALAVGSDGVTLEGSASGSLGTLGPGCLSLSWAWDGHTLEVASEPYGFFPAFYVADENQFALGMDAISLLRYLDRPRLDLEALSAFLYTGLYLEDRTFATGVAALPEGGRLRWRPGEPVELSTRPPHPGESTTDVEDMLVEYGRLMTRAVSLLPDKPATIPLSGGRDSRWLLLEWLSQGRTIERAVTARYFPHRFSDDVELAQELADRVGVPHVVVDQPRSLVAPERAKNEASSFAFLESGWQMALRAVIDSRLSPVLDGIANDVLARGTFWGLDLHRSAATDAAGVANALYGGRVARHAALFHGTDFEIWPWQDVLPMVERSLDSYTDSHNPLLDYQMWNRTRRQNSMLSVASYGADQIFCPALEAELFSFLRTLPVAVADGKPFQTKALGRAHPAAAAVPYESKPGGRVPWSFRSRTALDVIRLSDSSVVDRTELAVRAAKTVASGSPPRYFQLEAPRVVYLHQLLSTIEPHLGRPKRALGAG